MRSESLERIGLPSSRTERNKILKQKRGKINWWTRLKEWIFPKELDANYTHPMDIETIIEYVKELFLELHLMYYSDIKIPDDFYKVDLKIGSSQYSAALQEVYFDYLDKFRSNVYDYDGLRVSYCSSVEAIPSIDGKLKNYSDINVETIVYKMLLVRCAPNKDPMETPRLEERFYLAVLQLHGWCESSSVFFGISLLESVVADVSKNVLTGDKIAVLGAVVFELYQVYMYYLKENHDAQSLDLLRMAIQLKYPAAHAEGLDVFKKYEKKYPKIGLSGLIIDCHKFGEIKVNPGHRTSILKTIVFKPLE